MCYSKLVLDPFFFTISLVHTYTRVRARALVHLHWPHRSLCLRLLWPFIFIYSFMLCSVSVRCMFAFLSGITTTIQLNTTQLVTCSPVIFIHHTECCTHFLVLCASNRKKKIISSVSDHFAATSSLVSKVMKWKGEMNLGTQQNNSNIVHTHIESEKQKDARLPAACIPFSISQIFEQCENFTLQTAN